jgi:hypothetical protein
VIFKSWVSQLYIEEGTNDGQKIKACLFNLPKLKPDIVEAIQLKPSFRQSLKRGSMLRIFDYRLILSKVLPG